VRSDFIAMTRRRGVTLIEAAKSIEKRPIVFTLSAKARCGAPTIVFRTIWSARYPAEIAFLNFL